MRLGQRGWGDPMAMRLTEGQILAPGLSTKALTVDQFFDMIKLRQGRAMSAPDAYAKLAWTFRSVNLRADALAGIEYEILRANGEPFPWPFDLTEILWLCEAANVTVGKWYLEPIIENGLALTGLKWLNPLTIEPIEDEKEGIIGFVQNRGQKSEQRWHADQLVWYHRWGLASDTLPGPCELDVAIEATGLGINANAWASAFFRNSAIPAVLLSSEYDLDDDELGRIKRAWRKLTEGVRKAWGTVILRRGIKAQIIGHAPKDLAMRPLFDIARSQIAVSFGVPQTMLTDAANYATAKEHRLGYYQDTVFPSAKRLMARLNAQLFSRYRLSLAFQFATVEVVAQNEADKAQAYSSLLGTFLTLEQAQVITTESLLGLTNHLLEAMALPSVSMPTGPSLPEPGAPEPEPDAPGLSDEAWADLRRWRDKAQRLGPEAPFYSSHIPSQITQLVGLGLKHAGLKAFSFLKQVSMDEHSQIVQETIAKILSKYEASFADAIASGQPVDLQAFETDMRAAIEPKLIEVATEAGLRAAAGLGIEYDVAAINAEALDWARAYTYDLIKGIGETTRPIVQGAIEAYISTPGMTKGELKERLNAAFGAHRAELIAVTEVTRAYSQAQSIYQAMLEREAGIKMARVWGYTWSGIDTSGECPICLPLNGVIEDDRGLFVHPETGQQYDGPPAHVKCNCSTSLKYTGGKSHG